MPGDVLVYLVVAPVAGAIIGIQFELRERPGGLGTHTSRAWAWDERA
jgi:uncharacterized membrane protein YhiD involved in acid resistance